MAQNTKTYQTLTFEEKTVLHGWMGFPGGNFELLYKASRDGCSGPAFHQKCDNKESTVVVLYGTSGYVFGGYTALSWKQTSTWLADSKAFLYCLRNPQGKHQALLSATTSGHIYGHANYGPAFGNPTAFCLQTITKDNGFGTSGEFTPRIVTDIESYNYFNRGSLTNQTFNGGTTQVYDIEVYHVTELRIFSKEQSWRKLGPSFKWMPETLENEIKEEKIPDVLKVPSTKILLLGPVGHGKSSFFNTINSAFRGHVTSQAATGTGKHSVTTKYRVYKIRASGGDALNFRLCDTMGFEEDGGIIIHDIPYILDGNIQDHFQFNPASGITPSHPDFQSGPKLADKIHVAALVLDASSINELTPGIKDKLSSATKMLVHRGVPCVVLLTKVDKICEHVAGDPSMTFRSPAVLAAVGHAAEVTGLSRSHVLPVKNYELEISTEDATDTLALLALRQMLRFAGDFYNEQLDILGE